MEKITGRVWIFGDNIDTDVITPGPYVDAPMEEMVKHVLEAVQPEFAVRFRPGDIIVAGGNFGCGSSRETAPEALKRMGVGAIIARSFARIFFRNAVALGIPSITVAGAPSGFAQDDVAEVDVELARITNLTTGETIAGIPLYGDILNLIRKGGIVPLMREMVDRQKS